MSQEKQLSEIAVISGKGGTGKTSIVASFAALADGAVLTDCDVDAADLHLILEPEVKETHDFTGGKVASVLTDKCIGCGRCEQVCRFGAALFNGPANQVAERTYTIDHISCQGCGGCTHFCPVDAIDFRKEVNGQWFISDTRFGPMVHARLGPAQENSGKLVSLIRKEAKKLALEQGKELIIADASPGIGCPVIASIAGADLVVVVTEPTMSGRHDLGRVIELEKHFNIPAAVIINKHDINPEMTAWIEKQATQAQAELLGRINYDAQFTEAQIVAKSIVEYSNGAVTGQVSNLWDSVAKRIADNSRSKEVS